MDYSIRPHAYSTTAPAHPWLGTAQVQRYDALYDAHPSATLPLGDALDAILWGRYAPAITRLRRIYKAHGEDAYTQAKRQLPQYTFAGTFAPTRAKQHLEHHSGIVHADLDHLANLTATKLTIIQDPSVVYCFTSPRGDGLKYGVRIAPVSTNAAYEHAWQHVADQHRGRYGVSWDTSGKDVCRLCFVSWDAAIFINPDAAPCPVPLAPPAPKPSPVPMSNHWPSPRRRSAAQQALEHAEQVIAQAPVGSRHTTRLKASYLIGGYVASGELDYAQALARLTAVARANADTDHEAQRDIADGLRAGQSRPLTHSPAPIPVMTTVNAKELPPWHA